MRARANEKFPSPISRMLSVDRNGIVGEASGALSFPFFFGWDFCLDRSSASLAACSDFAFFCRRLCCDISDEHCANCLNLIYL